MRKKLLFVAAVATLCFTSCIRDEDKAMLKNPIHVVGSFSPQLGVPVGYGDVQLNDLLGMLDSNFTGYLDEETDVLTIVYEFDTTGSFQRSADARKVRYTTPKRRSGLKDGGSSDDELSNIDTIITLYDQDISLLSGSPIDLEQVKINFDSIKLALNLKFKGEDLSSKINDTIAENVKITLDSLTIDYIDNNGTPQKFNDLSTLRLIDNAAILEGNEIDTTLNIAKLISDLPKHMTVKIRMRLIIRSELIAGDVKHLNFDEQLNELQLAKIDYSAKVGVRFPFKLSIDSLPYEQTISLGNNNGLQSFGFDSIIENLNKQVEMGLDLTVNDASINLIFQNGIPLELAVDASIIDTNDNVILTQSGIIKGAEVAWSDEYNTNISAGYNTTQEPLVFGIHDTTTLNKIPGASKIKLKVGITSTQKKHIAIRRSDSMGIRAYVKLKANASFDKTLLEKPLPLPGFLTE